MRDDTTPSFLARWRRQRRSEPRVQEPADLGTAFGLEATLETALEPESTGAGAAQGDIGWLQRLLPGGRKPA